MNCTRLGGGAVRARKNKTTIRVVAKKEATRLSLPQDLLDLAETN